jgi:hypothetical protein
VPLPPRETKSSPFLNHAFKAQHILIEKVARVSLNTLFLLVFKATLDGDGGHKLNLFVYTGPQRDPIRKIYRELSELNLLRNLSSIEY